MPLPSPSSARPQEVPPRDSHSPPADSPPLTSQPMCPVPLSPLLSTSLPSLAHNDNNQDRKEANPMIMSSIKKVEEESANTRQEAVQLKKRLAELEMDMANLKRMDSPINGGSSNGAKADVARKTKEEVDRLLAKLEKERVEIDGKIVSIIDDGISRIKAEAARENINEPKRDWMEALVITAFYVAGFIMGVEWQENRFRKKFAKRRRA